MTNKNRDSTGNLLATSTASSTTTKEKADHNTSIEILTDIDISATYPDKLDLNRESTELLMKHYSE